MQRLQDHLRSYHETCQGHFAGRPGDRIPLSASQLVWAIFTVLLTNSIAVLCRCHRLVHQAVESPQANRGNLFITIFQIIHKGLDFSCGLWISTTPWLPNGTPDSISGATIGALQNLSIEMYRRCYEVDMRLNMLRQVVRIACYIIFYISTKNEVQGSAHRRAPGLFHDGTCGTQSARDAQLHPQ